MRLIDADALKPLLREYCVDDDEVVMKWYDIMGVDEVVDRAPTVDAVPVVRCKDCIYYQDNNNGYPHNECRWRTDETPDETDFCSFGEREGE